VCCEHNTLLPHVALVLRVCFHIPPYPHLPGAQVEGAVNIAAIACGAFHNLALVADGSVLSWGTNDYGQLGNGSTIYSTTPVEVRGPDAVHQPSVGVAFGRQEPLWLQQFPRVPRVLLLSALQP
jgi:hypothetical protein